MKSSITIVFLDNTSTTKFLLPALHYCSSDERNVFLLMNYTALLSVITSTIVSSMKYLNLSEIAQTNDNNYIFFDE